MTNQTNMALAQFSVGDRVQLQPWTDRWMSGDRYGTIVAIGRFYLHVRMDRSGRTLRFAPENVKEA